VTIPARPEYVAVVRLAAAGIAGRMAFSFDDAEDLKIAVGEAATAAILAGGQVVQIVFEIAPDRLTIQVAHKGRSKAKPGELTEQGELGMFLMRCLMDEVHSGREGARHVTRITKLLLK
jgi:serine/threonine-protein kinase RsbW